jgi:hypothetical protein
VISVRCGRNCAEMKEEKRGRREIDVPQISNMFLVVFLLRTIQFTG